MTVVLIIVKTFSIILLVFIENKNQSLKKEHMIYIVCRSQMNWISSLFPFNPGPSTTTKLIFCRLLLQPSRQAWNAQVLNFNLDRNIINQILAISLILFSSDRGNQRPNSWFRIPGFGRVLERFTAKQNLHSSLQSSF